MTAALSFGLLGELTIFRGAERIPLTTGKLRVVLATLLLRANQIVTVDELIERLWGDRPPGQARPTVQTYVRRLRLALGDVPIHARPGGYVIELEPERLDLSRFRGLVERASRLDAAGAVTVLGEALALWRGPVLADVPSESLRRDVVPRLAEERLGVLERRIELELELGCAGELVGELSGLIAEHPLRERFWGQLMLALFRSGRQAEALQRYRAVRELLMEELGVEPGPELRRLHAAILAADPALGVSRPELVRSPLPRQLPAAPGCFAGRQRELARLTATLDGGVVSAIVGAGGVGKTWLALHWAHRNVDRFPDGQLFVDLRGFSPAGEPLPPGAAVRGFLDALGVAPARVPVELDAQVGLYRSLVADKRMLIVLDNARDTAQVVPLLPGSPSCAVIVTSRDRLAGLATTHGAHTLPLDALAEPEARDLLADRLGAVRLRTEPDATAELLASCAGLPLALGIVAARAAAHPDLPLAMWADELRGTGTRLDALHWADPAASLSAVLSWSHAALGPRQAEVFGLLGLAPGPDIGLPAAASLAGLSTTSTRAVLGALEQVSLAQQHRPGRWRMHDLIRLYAATQANLRPEGQRQAALRRLVDHYTHTAVAAERLLDPHRPPIELGAGAAGCEPHPLADQTAALAWLDTEHPCLLATQHLAAELGWHHAVWRLAWTLTTFHYRRGRHQDLLVSWQRGLTAAHHLDDPATQTLAHRQLGLTSAGTGRHAEALDHLRQALALAEHTADLPSQAHAHQVLASACAQRGDDHRALRHATYALHLFQALDNPVWRAVALNQVGWFAARLGQHTEARVHCQAALTVCRRHHDRAGEANTLDSLGYIAHHTSRHTEAVGHYRRAIVLYRHIGHAYGEADTLDRLGHTHTALGHHEHARQDWRKALELYQTQHRTQDVRRVQHQLDNLVAQRS